MGLLLAGGLALTATGCTGEEPSAPAAVASSSAAAPPPSASDPTPSDTTSSTAPAASWVEAENDRPGDSGWRITKAGDPYRLAGFADRASVRPGDPVRLSLSSAVGPVTVTAYRMGWYGGKNARVVWRAARPVDPGKQAAPSVGEGHVVTARWKPTMVVDTTDWPPGSYVFLLSAGAERKWVPLTVVSPDVEGRLVLVTAVATYQAYNTWGGYSLYKGADGTFGSRATTVSFDRPYDERGADTFMKQELKPVAFAEQLGLDLAYVTSVELDRDPHALDGARGVVFLGHDEYWSVPMRTTVEQARDAGVNVAFLGGNNVYWRVRFDASADGRDGRLLVGHKSADTDPVQGPTTTDLWRRGPGVRPENSLVGMLYECFPAQGDLVVERPSSFLFAGTKVRRGSRVAGLIGVEIDRAYPIKGTPKNLEVVAHSPVPCA